MKSVDDLIQQFSIKINDELEKGNTNQHHNINALAALITARANYEMCVRYYKSGFSNQIPRHRN